MGPFKEILVIADWTFPEDQELGHILQFCKQNADIPLLYNRGIKHSYFKAVSFNKKNSLRTSMNKVDTEQMNLTKAMINELRPDIKVTFSLTKDLFLYQSLRRSVSQLLPDLLVLKRKAKIFGLFSKNVFQLNRLKKVDINAALFVKDDVPFTKIVTVIVTVQDKISQKKLNVLESFGKNTHLKIHIISYLNEGLSLENNKVHSNLVNSFRLLKERLNCSIYHDSLSALNWDVALTNYSARINADLLLIDTELETQRTWWKRKPERAKQTLMFSN